MLTEVEFIDKFRILEYYWQVKRGVLVSTKQQVDSLASFQMFYEELPATKRVTRVRRVRTS